jgi:hypothetical protein
VEEIAMSLARFSVTLGAALGVAMMLGPTAWAKPYDCSDKTLSICWKRTTKNDVKGVQCKWGSMPIPYKINAKLIKDANKKQKAIDAVKSAFTAFEGISCSNLSFTYAGEETTSFSSVTGYILVYFGDTSQDASSWIAGTAAYYRDMNYTDYYKTGQILWASLGMNAKDYGWYVYSSSGNTDIVTVTGKMIDIKTSVMWMIPDAIGYYVGTDSTMTNLPIAYDSELTSLCSLLSQGAQYTYFKSGTGCTQPTISTVCAGGDVVKEGTAPHEYVPTDKPIYEAGASGDGGGGGDGAHSGDATFPPKDDGGCCRVSHARSEGPGAPTLVLLGLAGVLLLVRARSRRR